MATVHEKQEWERVLAKLREIERRPGPKETVASGLAAVMVQSAIETGAFDLAEMDAYERARGVGAYSSPGGAYRNVRYIAKCYIMDAARQCGIRMELDMRGDASRV